MEGGILAILGGQPVIITGETNDQSDNNLLEERPFRNMLESAAARLDEQGGTIKSSDPVGEMIDRVPTVLLYDLQSDVQLIQFTDITLRGDLANLQADTLERLTTLNPSQANVPLPLYSAVSLADYARQANVAAENDESELRADALLQVTDSFSGSDLLDPASEVVTIIPVISAAASSEQSIELANMPLLVIRQNGLSDPDILSPQQLEEWKAILADLQELAEQHEELMEGIALSDESIIPLVSFSSSVNVAALQPLLRDGSVQSIQLVAPGASQAASGNAAMPLSQPIMDALAQDDLAQLSDDDLAELDALIDRVTQGVARKEDGANGFRGLLSEQFAAQTRQITAESAQAAQITDTTAKADTDLLQTTTNSTHQLTAAAQDTDARMILRAAPSQLPANATPTEQVKVVISQAFQSGMDRIVVQLDPAELGKVDVRLDLSQDGRVNVLVQADNKDTLEMLQRDSRILEKALQDAGLDANAQDMEFAWSGEGKDKEDAFGTKDALEEAYEETVEELRQPELTMDPLTGHYTLSIAQGLDIKV